MAVGLPASCPMRNCLFALFSMSALLAQPGAAIFQKAPPAQDAALRQRANEFYQAHVDGKTRKAMALVAEESADLFFNALKPKLNNFEIQSVTYGKELKDATVLILAEREFVVPFGGVQLMKVPMESHWKLVENEWLWYIPLKDCKETPFGCSPTGNANAGDTKTADEIKKKVEAIGKGNLEGQFGLDKTQVDLTTGGTADVTFSNGMSGYLSLRFVPSFADDEIELINAEQQVKPNGSAKFTVRVKKGVKIAKARDISIPLYVQPFQRLAGLRVSVKPE
jgi:hypothetical protein